MSGKPLTTRTNASGKPVTQLPLINHTKSYEYVICLSQHAYKLDKYSKVRGAKVPEDVAATFRFKSVTPEQQSTPTAAAMVTSRRRR